MGGMSSTRWGYGPTKRKTTGCLPIDIRQLKRDGKLITGIHQISWPNGSRAMLDVDSEQLAVGFNIEGKEALQIRRAWIDYTTPNYGGERPWLACGSCGKRFAVLYLNAGALACRQCHGLLYPSQVESGRQRAIRKAQVIGLRAGIGSNLVIGRMVATKPKHMTERRWQRLTAEYDVARARALLLSAV